MKVLLINPRSKNNRDSAIFPLGVLSIATHLQKCGHVVKILDRMSICTNLRNEFREFRPDIVGISFLSTRSIKDTIKICSIARAASIPIVFGNTLASAVPERLLEAGYADYITIGEGEFIWEDLLIALEQKTSLYDIDGLAFIDNGKIIINKTRAIANAAMLPIIDWSLIDPKKYFRSQYGCDNLSYLYSGKGCNGSCSFCFNKAFHHCTYRARPIENVLAEIKCLADNYGMDGVFFADELWCLNREEMREKCDAFRNSGINFKWGCQLRIGMFEAEDYEYMYKSGCRSVFFGVETGSKEVLKRIHKPIKYEDIVSTVKMCSEAGIAPVSSFIFGIPGETFADLKATADIIKAIRPYSLYQTFFFCPYVGTDLYNELKESGKLDEGKGILDLKGSYTYSLQTNYTKVSDKELNVVRSFTTWWSLTSFNIVDEKNHSHTFNTFIRMLQNLTQNGIKYLPANLFYSMKEFISVLFYITCFPKIKKKYGLKIWQK